MCDPASAIAITSFIGTGISAYGQYRASQSASNEAKYKSRIASNNAIIANQNAQQALERGEADIRDKRRETQQRAGLQRAQLAAAGFDVSGGSSIDILSDTAALGELDVLRIDADAQNRARNLRVQASSFEAEAGFGRFAAKSARRAGRLQAGSTLITGASRSGSTYLNLKP